MCVQLLEIHFRILCQSPCCSWPLSIDWSSERPRPPKQRMVPFYCLPSDLAYETAATYLHTPRAQLTAWQSCKTIMRALLA